MIVFWSHTATIIMRHVICLGFLHHAHDLLIITQVSTSANQSVLANFLHPSHVPKPRQRTVGPYMQNGFQFYTAHASHRDLSRWAGCISNKLTQVTVTGTNNHLTGSKGGGKAKETARESYVSSHVSLVTQQGSTHDSLDSATFFEGVTRIRALEIYGCVVHFSTRARLNEQ